MKLIDLTGRRFNRLTVEGRAQDYISPRGHRLVKWSCRCDCGASLNVMGNHLKRGATQSCGCHNSDVVTERNTTHGMSDYPLYSVWTNMLARCLDQDSPSFSRYGQRGITVCDQWLTFPGYVQGVESEIGPRPTNPDGWDSRTPYWTVDRIDNDGGYMPGNVRWATPYEQTHNRRPRTACRHGHAYTPENLYVSPVGKRQCRACWRASHER